jgi:glycosyltransferase involved in cell wall biosynthesis
MGHEVIELYGDSFGREGTALQLTRLYFPVLVAAVARLQRVDIIDVHSADGWLVRQRGLVTRSHGLEYAHWPVVQRGAVITRRFRWYMERYRLPAARRAFQRAARIVSPSTSDAGSFRLLNLSPEPPIEVVPHGLARHWMDSAGRSRSDGLNLRMLFVGDWSYTKGGDRLPAVISELLATGVSPQLTVVTPDAADVVRSSFGADASLVTVLAPVTPTQMEPLMAKHDVLLVPSRYEPYGRVVAEGMAVGLLVVTTRTGCALDHFVDGENGIFVDFDSPFAVAARMSDCLSRIDAIGQRARQAVRHLTWEYVAKRTSEVYRRALE